MQKTVEQPPRTIMEVYKMLPEGTLAELIDGILYMSPAPNLNHQSLVFLLGGLFFNYIQQRKSGTFFPAPVDVYFDDHQNAVQPDFVFVSQANAAILKEDATHGVPDFILEVLSPGNKKYDREKKKGLYERFGVKEYWIIDPATKEAQGYLLKNKKFEALPVSTGVISSILLDHTFNF